MSDFPPNPPMRSAPRVKAASISVRARSSSTWVGPFSRKRESSSRVNFSTAWMSPPGRAVAWIRNWLPISPGPCMAMTSVAIWASYTSRL